MSYEIVREGARWVARVDGAVVGRLTHGSAQRLRGRAAYNHPAPRAIPAGVARPVAKPLRGEALRRHQLAFLAAHPPRWVIR